MNKKIVIAWIDPEGKQIVTDETYFDGANYHRVVRRAPNASALVFGDANKNYLARAEEFAREKRSEYGFIVEIYTLPADKDILTDAKKRILADNP